MTRIRVHKINIAIRPNSKGRSGTDGWFELFNNIKQKTSDHVKNQLNLISVNVRSNLPFFIQLNLICVDAQSNLLIFSSCNLNEKIEELINLIFHGPTWFFLKLLNGSDHLCGAQPCMPIDTYSSVATGMGLSCFFLWSVKKQGLKIEWLWSSSAYNPIWTLQASTKLIILPLFRFGEQIREDGEYEVYLLIYLSILVLRNGFSRGAP